MSNGTFSKAGAFASMVLFVLTAAGQETTGSLSGRVTDPSGMALPGVTVEVSGAALQGRRSAVTAADGRYRIRHLPPGEGYVLTATLEGFGSGTKQGIRVFLGQEGTSNLELRPAFEESITVLAETPLIDLTRTTTGLNITAKQFDSLPTARSYQSLTAMAPGVSLVLGERRRDFARSPSVGGSTPAENNYIIEGLSTTDSWSGLSATRLSMNFVEEVQVLTGGYSAEFGRSTGGVFNVVTKSGGNDFHGDLFAYYQNDDWSSKNISRRYRGTSTKADGIDNRDAGMALGGPIFRDRLWFFVAYDPTRSITRSREFIDASNFFVNEEHEFEVSSEIAAAKLTWALGPSHQVVATSFTDATVEEGWLGRVVVAAPVALRRVESGGMNSVARYTGSIGPSFVVEARAGRHEDDDDIYPITELGWTVPRQRDNVIGRTYGGWFYRQDELASRDIAFLKMNRYSSHYELSGGIDLEHNKYDANWSDHFFVFNGRRRISGTIGVQDHMTEFIHHGTGRTDTQNQAVFLENRWQPRPNLRVNIGVRYERQILDSANDLQLTDGYLPDGSLSARKVPELALDNNWAPRVGVIWDPLNTGRTKVFAHVGRYYEAIPLSFSWFTGGNFSRIRNRYYSTTRHTNDWYNPTGSPLASGDWIRYQTADFEPDDFAAPVDANIRAQHQDEYILGGEYQFAAHWSGGLRLVNRRIRRVIEDFGVFGDPEDPLRLTGYVIGNPGEGAFGSIFRKPKRDYRAVELTLQRRQTTTWQLQSSFVYAHARGDYEGLYLEGYNQLLPNLTAYYDLPAFQGNAFGSLPSDRPYQLKVHGSYRFPFGLTLSEGFAFSSGSPVSALGPEIYTGYGDGLIFLKPRGSEGRTSDYWTLDLHAHYLLPFFRREDRGLSLIVDVFNATNNHAALVVDQNYIYSGMPGFDRWEAPENLDPFGNPRFNADLPRSPYFKTPLVYQAPRFVQLGMKFTF